MRSYLSALLFILSFGYSFTQHLVNESNYRILTDESYREYLRLIKFDEITTHFDTSFSLTVCRSPFHPCAEAMMFSYDHGIPKYEYYQNTTYQILGDLKCNCGLDNLSIQFPDNMPDGDYIYLREGTDIPLLKFSLRNQAYDKMHYQYYDNGNIERITEYLLGQKIGTQISFYEDGVISELNNYNRNKWHGKRSKFYQNGVLKEMLTYEMGLKDGQEFQYSEEGQLFKIITYKLEKKEGEEWELTSDRLYLKTYKNDTLNGVMREYQTDSTLLIEKNYVGAKLNGSYKFNYPDGTNQELANYKDDELDGEMTLYTKDGKVECKTTFQDGEESGTRRYHRDGIVVAESEYKNGELQRTVIYDKKLKRELKKIDSGFLKGLKL